MIRTYKRGDKGKIVVFEEEENKTLCIVVNDCYDENHKDFYMQHRQMSETAREKKVVSFTAKLLGGMVVREKNNQLIVSEASSSIPSVNLPSWLQWPEGIKRGEFDWEIQHLLNLEVAMHLARLTKLPAFAEKPGYFPECPFCGKYLNECPGH